MFCELTNCRKIVINLKIVKIVLRSFVNQVLVPFISVLGRKARLLQSSCALVYLTCAVALVLVITEDIV